MLLQFEIIWLENAVINQIIERNKFNKINFNNLRSKEKFQYKLKSLLVNDLEKLNSYTNKKVDQKINFLLWIGNNQYVHNFFSNFHWFF